MDFEQNELFESMSDLNSQNRAEGDLPQWVRDNLETQQQEVGGLPEWVLENLRENPPTVDEAREQFDFADRVTEVTETLGGVIREFIQRLTGDTDNTVEERYDIQEATEGWHLQEEMYSCANACQEFIIDEFLDIDVEESDLNAIARENNWLHEDGTYLEDVGNLLEAYGIETHRYMNAGFENIREALNNGDRVIVAVYNAALEEDWCDMFPVTSANHAIEVIGIDDSDPSDIKVIINDPGVMDGCGKEVSLDTFNQARNGSGGFMVVAERP